MATLTAPRAVLFPSRRGQCRGRLQTRVYAAALPEQFTGKQFTILSTNVEATQHLAELMAADLRAGDAFCLKGDEGAGKSTWTAAFVRAATRDASLEVPPPPQGLRPNEYRTQGLIAPAEFGELPLLHYDVGTLPRPSDDECEMIAGTFPACVSVVEWAETLRHWGAAPEQRLAIWFRRLPSQPDSDVRLVTVVPHTGAWEVRAGLMQANLSISGPPMGLMMLGEDMAAQLTAGFPESLALVS